MSTDLTFITNESGQTLLDRFNDLLKEDTHLFDCLVGYFFLSGFYKLYPSLEKTEKIRILIGLKTDPRTFELIQQGNQELDFKSHAETKEEMPGRILDELEDSDDFHIKANASESIEMGVRKFVEWIRSGKLEIKAYPTDKIHAKLYVMTFHEGDRDKGRVVTGSSNFSQSGFQDNLEFNVELKNRSDYEFALANFNRLWEKAVDVSSDYVTTIEEKSPFANFTPYELYLKFLYEYFKSELSPSEALERVYQPINFKRLRYQEDAVMTAKKILDEYGGVFISDVVGLGKTYISALLAQQLPGRTLVLAPPTLLDPDNPGSWTSVFEDFRIPFTKCSIGKLDDLLKRGVDKYDNVFIDEAHRFRTEATPTYETLYKICRGKKVILVSATPLNNSPRDILSQIKLFQPGKNSTIPNVRDLEYFFGELEKKLKKLDRKKDREEYLKTVRENSKAIRERVLKYLMIRRTRTEVQTYYGTDLSEQGLKFPEVADPEPLFYQFSQEENEVFNETIERLAQDFSYARYKPLTYYEGDARESEIQGQQNLAKFMKILLVKRLESSLYAFQQTIERFIQSYERYIEEFNNGQVYISKKHIHKIFEWLDDDNADNIEKLIEEEKAEKLDATDFSPQFIKDLNNDLQILREVHALWVRFKRDPKWTAFAEFLRTNKNVQSNKLVIFSESKETAAYLTKRFKEDLNENVLLFTGESSEERRKTIIDNFDANVIRQKDDCRILVTTEVLAEGVNLHRANTVINYDIPWNPTRLMQRVGRVNRINTKFSAIYTYNFFPTEESNDVIKLKEAAETKIHGFIEMLGADARLLTDGEEIKSHDLFQQLNSRKTITGEDEGEETELEYLKEIRDVRDNNSELFARIKKLPKKARSAKRNIEKANSLLTYFRKGKLEKFYLAKPKAKEADEIDFFRAVSFLKATPDDEPQRHKSDFYQLLDRNKQAFLMSTMEEHIEKSLAGRDNATKILMRLRAKEIKHYDGYIEEDEEYIKSVIRLLEDGILPKPTTKKILKDLSQESDPQRVLGILKRHISDEFFKATHAEKNRSFGSPREVILSSYLVGE